MTTSVLGIHHITAIARNARGTHDFYTRVLGLRFVKKTVNFDDPGTYHFYFGDETGTPGTILTFFPWENISRGRPGTGMVTDIAYSVAAGALDFWKQRLSDNGITLTGAGKRFGEDYLSFSDPDGLSLTLLVPAMADKRKPWTTAEIAAGHAVRGFHGATLSLQSSAETARVLTDIFQYTLQGREGQRHRYVTHAVEGAAAIDLVEQAPQPRGINAGGTVHHIAFRVSNEDTLMAYREKVLAHGLNVTGKIDRNYFFSIYFREPGGVLFELATDNPGFAVDEPVDELGTHLKLPPQYEQRRREIEQKLPALN